MEELEKKILGEWERYCECNCCPCCECDCEYRDFSEEAFQEFRKEKIADENAAIYAEFEKIVLMKE